MPVAEDAPFDPGLQAERTLLAWRRTALSLGLASVVALRLTVAQFGVPAVAVGGAGVLLAFLAYLTAAHRYRAAHDSLVRSGPLPGGGLPLLLLTVTALVVGAACAAYVLGHGPVP